MKYSVHHSEPPDFLAARNKEEFPYGYKHVADVDANTIDEVWTLTNTIEEPWWLNKGVFVHGLTSRGHRSTSVGDVVVAGNNEKAHYRCEMVGWASFVPTDHKKRVDELKKLYEDMLPMMKLNCRRDKGLMPVAFVLFGGKNMDVVGMPYKSAEERIASFKMINRILKEKNAEGVIFACETWVVEVKGVYTIEEARKMRQDMPDNLGDVEGRKEKLFILMMTHGFQEVHDFEIVRKGKDIEFMEDPEGQPEEMTQEIITYFRQK